MERNRLPALPIALAPETAFLVHDGLPVFPVSPTDIAPLTELASIFGCDVNTVETDACTELETRPHGAARLVGCFDKGLLPLAELYAYLTGRDCRLLAGLRDLRANALDVVLLRNGELTFDLLEEIAESASGPAKGIIAGDGYDEVRSQVLNRAATTHLLLKSPPHRVDVLPTVPMDIATSDARTLVGGNASPAELRAAISRGSAIVHILAHSDGIDAFLGEDVLLCPMTPTLIGERTSATPRCSLTRFCHVENGSFDEVRQTGRLIHPRDARSAVLIYNSCFGILPANAWVDPVWSSGFHFASNPKIGAFITTWEISTVESSDADLLIERIMKGETLGSAVAAYNRSSEAAVTRGHRLVLFGDPAMALAR